MDELEVVEKMQGNENVPVIDLLSGNIYRSR